MNFFSHFAQMVDVGASAEPEISKSVNDVRFKSISELPDGDTTYLEAGEGPPVPAKEPVDGNNVQSSLKRSDARAAALRQSAEIDSKIIKDLEQEKARLEKELADFREGNQKLWNEYNRFKDSAEESEEQISQKNQKIREMLTDERIANDERRTLERRFSELQAYWNKEAEGWKKREKSLTQDKDNLTREVLNQKARINILNSENARLQKAEKDKARGMSDANSKLLKLKDVELECTQLRASQEQQLKHIAELTETSRQQMATIDQQGAVIETSVTKYQMAAVSMLSQSVSTPLPDDLVKKRFKELFEDVENWARDNATRNVLVAHAPEIQQLEGKLLRRFDARGSCPNYNFDFEDPTAMDSLLVSSPSNLPRENPSQMGRKTFSCADTPPECCSSSRPLPGIFEMAILLQ